MNIEAMAIRCEEQELSSPDVDTACQVAKISRLDFFDQLARWLAIEFLEGRRDFTFCDDVANNMMPIAEWTLTDFAWSVFHAFDNGEFYHPEDSRDVDPVEKYTRPILRQALADQGYAARISSAHSALISSGDIGRAFASVYRAGCHDAPFERPPSGESNVAYGPR